LADGKNLPEQVIEHDTHFASQLFNITNAKRMVKMAQKERDDSMEEIYVQRLEDAHHLADEYKGKIQEIFQYTFGV
jgi:hypothetical protein